MKVKDVMHTGIDYRQSNTSLLKLAQLMRDHDIGAVAIGERNKLLGIVTDRDIVCRALASGQDLHKITAADIMSREVISCRLDEDVEDAVHLMEQKHVRRLPVLDQNQRMVGMLSMGDLSHAVNYALSGELTAAVSAHHIQ